MAEKKEVKEETTAVKSEPAAVAEEAKNTVQTRVLPPVPLLQTAKTSFSGRIRIRYMMEHPDEFIDKIVFVGGWARTLRFTKKIAFCELNDGSGPQGLQIVIDKGLENYSALEKCRAGSCLGFKGKIVKSPGTKQPIEMQVQNNPEHQAKIFGESPAETYPLAKKEHTLEYLRDIAHLRPRTQLISAAIRMRNALIMASHSFFQQKGFLYIHTPLITTSDCEGAGEMFQVTTMLSQIKDDPTKLKVKPETKTIDYTEDFFKKPAFLTVSGQLDVESYCCSLSDVYTFGPTFRAENSHTARHLAEFWMIEPEVAFADVNDLQNLAEDYLKFCIQYVMKNNMDDLKFFEEKQEKGLIARLNNVIESTFERLTYTKGVEILMNLQKEGKVKFEHEVYWGLDLFFEHERYLTEEIFKKPVILTDYPKDLKAFYMKLNEDNKTVRGMDVLVPKIGEIVGGSQREENLEVLDKRIDEMKLDKAAYWWYRELRKYGSVPHSGFGVGFERMIMLVTGIENIRDTIPFPRAAGQAEFQLPLNLFAENW